MRFAQELERWEGEAVEHWRLTWRLPRLHILEYTGSTNDDIRQLADERAPELTVVIAERQTAGRGQHGRTWQGTPGKSLHFSALLRPSDTSCLSAAPVRVGLSIVHELRALTHLTIGLKWPNDLDHEGRKLGGILCESVSSAGTVIVVGIGVNVGQQPEDFADGVRARATSLALAGSDQTRPAVAGALCRALHGITRVAAAELSRDELEILEQVDVLNGLPIEVDGAPAGRARGITSAGALRTEHDGRIVELRTGSVRPVSGSR